MRDHLTEEHKAKIREAALKRRHPEEVKKKIAEKMKGNKNAQKKGDVHNEREETSL